ncbi:MAG: glutamine-hydrolyzing GMP synthase [Candidatus Omnitrophota bacterium]|nr:glutamine-hydrolyzing GMP synthase [Candidatus Omnitrophota bacterium]
MAKNPQETILILDFGSQYAQLIARRVRELNVFSKIVPYTISPEQIARENPKGIILSGGPASVWAKGAPKPDRAIFRIDRPMLGICYGMQLMGQMLGGGVSKAAHREFGKARLRITEPDSLFKGLSGRFTCWMSHGDYVTKLPPGFKRIARTANTPIAAMGSSSARKFGVQFHPEVMHTNRGKEVIRNFLYGVCRCRGDWSPRHFIRNTIREIREKVGDSGVVLGLSGGVDSSVAALLVYRAIGKRLVPIFVDTGLLRKGEREEVIRMFKGHFKMPLVVVDAETRFLKALRGIEDPEEKRRRIGRLFISCFEEEAKKHRKAGFLGQGTLYPDVIESVSPLGGPSAVIKTHHNVGGLPKGMKFKLIEPLRFLFKDEVRETGRQLGLPDHMLGRHPFPGPGLGIRILGAVTKQRLDLLREADARFIGELRSSGWYSKVWQAFAVLLPVRSVGVMGDERTYENVVALRAVTSTDGMTADWARLPQDLLERASNRIVNEVRGINRVVYDVTSKPPGTIEWE